MYKEVRLLSNLKHDYIIDYKTAWIQYELINISRNIYDSSSSESDCDEYKRLMPVLYIQMELCHMTLDKAIEEMDDTLNQSIENGISFVGIYIAYELFKQILEGVNYLHTRDPPIIHRDLNPRNILITNNGINGNFIKITDFGVSTIHELESNETTKQFEEYYRHTSNVGNFYYMAPEVKNSGEYDTKSDMFSIAIIMTELFGINDFTIKLFTVRDKFYKLESDSDLDQLSENINSENKPRFSVKKLLDKLQQIFSNLIEYRFTCNFILSREFYDLINFNDIKYEYKVELLCYELGQLDYTPNIKEFTNYFLWNKIKRDIISNNFLESNLSRGIDLINSYQINHKLSANNSHEIISFAYHEFYTNLFNSNEYKTLLKRLCDKTNMKWFTCYLSKYTAICTECINWADCDFYL
jgi:serine/threonine protein kinase